MHAVVYIKQMKNLITEELNETQISKGIQAQAITFNFS